MQHRLKAIPYKDILCGDTKSFDVMLKFDKSE